MIVHPRVPGFFCCLVVLSVPAASQNSAWYIDTLAGKDRPLNDGGPATSALLNSPAGLAVDLKGNVIFADAGNHRIRKISPSGTITTIAGTGVAGYSGDGSPAISAQIDSPEGVATDIGNNIFFADYNRNVVRKITPDGIIHTIGGTGFPGNSGDGGPAIIANLNGPYGVAVDGKGGVVVTDFFNDAVRLISAGGTISHVANVRGPSGVTVDKYGNICVGSPALSEILRITVDGTVTVLAGTGGSGYAGDGGPAVNAKILTPRGLAADGNGNLWFADSGNDRIRMIDPGGVIHTIAGSGRPGHNDPAAGAFQVDISEPDGIFADPSGVYWAETGNQKIRKYDSLGSVKDVAGSWPPLTADGPPGSLPLFNPFSAIADKTGNLYISDSSNNVVRKVTPDGSSSVVAGTGIAGFNAYSGIRTGVMLNNPGGLALDSAGNLLIADYANGLVRSVDASGGLETVAGGGNYLPLTGTSATQAALLAPIALATVAGGGFYLLDQYFEVALNVSASATISLFDLSSVGDLNFPAGIAVGSDGAVYIADTFNNRILRCTRFGQVVTVVAGTGAPGYSGDGEPATNASLYWPYAVAVDANNNLYIADSGNYRIRQVDATGTITTIAGNGLPGFAGDKGIATLGQVGFVTGLSLDPTGRLIVADSSNQRIRSLTYQQIIPDFSISLDSSSKTVNQGEQLSVTISIKSVTGLKAPVTVSVSGQPGGVNMQFSPNPISVVAGKTNVVSATSDIPTTAAVGSTVLTFQAASGSLVKTVNLTLNIGNAPVLTSAGVVSAASFAGGGVSPGEIIAIFGNQLGPASLAAGAPGENDLFPTTVAGTQVTFDGIPAPLIFVSSGQVAAVVPYAIADRSTTQMQVQYNSQKSSPVMLTVVEAAPALFNAGGSQAAALNQDGTVNSSSNPARAGTEIVLFGTGEGVTNPGGTDGKVAKDVFPAPILKATVTIGGEAAIVDYAGAAPYEVAGVMQINARIPADLPSGPAVVVVTVGTHSSTGTSTISIH